MSKVIIVSNRLPVSVKKENGRIRYQSSLGGLATGLSSYVQGKGNIWIGWPGINSEEINETEKSKISAKLLKQRCVPIWLTKKQVERYYDGFSNGILWPAFHSLRLRHISDEKRQEWWRAYREVNKIFAEAVINQAESGDRIWVHDYQLMLVPEQIRLLRAELGPGFFLHIPFPPYKNLEKLPEGKRLVKGILGAQVIGFHTDKYLLDFTRTVQDFRLADVEANQIFYDARIIHASSFPMGIDYDKYARASQSKAVRQAYKKYTKRYRHKKLIVAVDRLDPTKGLLERLKAYRLFLEQHPRRQGKVVFVMVAAPSRTGLKSYQVLAKKLNSLAEEINMEYGKDGWQPLHLINEAMPFEEIAALFQLADVAFITPLRDGMNLVAKEFVASAHKNGVLILSETAGAASELEDAIIVKPRQTQQLADALEQALGLRRRDLKRRLRRMQQQIQTNTVHDWAQDFIETLNQPVPGTPNLTKQIRSRLHTKILHDYKTAQKRLLLLDYDGSLVPFAPNYEHVNPPKSLLNLLQKLAETPGNEVVMISGRKSDDLEQWFGYLDINLVAEHGAAIKRRGHKRWQLLAEPEQNWKSIIGPALERYASDTPKSTIENKPHTLVWHYRSSPPYSAQKNAVIIKRVLKPYLKEFGLEIMQGNKILEIKNPAISKGVAAERWLSRHYDFVFGLGDDLTDEELFAALPDDATSVKVGHGRTRANYRLPDFYAVRDLLKDFTKID